MILPGYWMDIGQPADYLIGMSLHLTSLRKHHADRLATGAHIKGNVLIDPTATIGAGCLLGPDVVVGPGCIVEDGARLERTTLLAGTRVCSHSFVASSIIGWGSTIGRWARVEGGTVFGEDVQLADERTINGAFVLPHKSLKENIHAPGRIVM
jgi:mannose-1-phosphate guanylyltransferase